MLLALFSAFVFFFGGCVAENASRSDMGQDFTIKISEEKEVGEGLRLKFTEVVEDSRCPEGVDCIWAGRAIVRIEIIRDDDRHIFDLELGEEKNVAEFEEIRIVVKELLPYPKADVPIKQEEYSVKLQLERNETVK
jgi:hypothetical protein